MTKDFIDNLYIGIFQDSDERKVPIAFGEVEAVADDELVRDREAEIVDFYFLLTSLVLIQQRRQLHTRCTARVQVRQQVRKRETSINDVFNDEYVTALDGHVEIFHDANLTRSARRRSVARDRHELETQARINRSHQIA